MAKLTKIKEESKRKRNHIWQGIRKTFVRGAEYNTASIPGITRCYDVNRLSADGYAYTDYRLCLKRETVNSV